MLSHIVTQLQAFREEWPTVFLFTVASIILLSISYALIQFFMPVGKRKLANGTWPVLPPGPKGLPLIGMLAAIGQGGNDELKPKVRL